MRFILAAIALVASLALFGVGIFQVIEARASDHVTAQGAASAGAPVLVIPSDTLAAHPGAQRIDIAGDGPIVAVVGRQGDVAGWVGDATHELASFDRESGQILFSPATGAEATVPDPTGSDLWYAEYAGEGALQIEATLPPGFAVLVTGTGDAPAPSQLSITWPLDGRAPWAGPLLLGGAVFLLIALGLGLWGLIEMRRGIKPRRKSNDGPVSLAPSRATAAGTGAEAARGDEPDQVAEPFAVPVTEGDVPSWPPPTTETPVADPRDRDPLPSPWATDSPEPATTALDAVDAQGEAPSWQVPSAADAEQAPSWQGASAADAEQAPSWQVPSAADAEQAPSWQVPSAADAEQAPSWQVPSAADAEHAPSWQAPSAADAEQVPSWQVPSAADAEQAPSWQAASAADAEQAPSWQAAPAADADAEQAPSWQPEPAPPVESTHAWEAPAGTATSAWQAAPTDDAPTDDSAATPAAEAAQDDRPTEDDRGDDDTSGPDSGSDGGSGAAGSAPSGGEPQDKWRRPRGRDRSAAPKRLFRIVPVFLVGTLFLSGCAPSMWPEAWGGADENPTATPTSTVDQALLEEGAPLPALSDTQLTAILADVTAVVEAADAASDATLLEPRFAGSALLERTAMYAAKQKDGALPGPDAFPSGAVAYTVPEATDAWPRTVFTVLESGVEGEAPFGIMLVQPTAREPYRVASLTQLVPNVSLPEAAPATIGAPGLAALAPSLLIAPDQLAAEYGSVISQGDASPSAAKFEAEGDTFRTQVGQEYRDKKLASIDQANSKLEFTNKPGDDAPVGVGTLDGGAIVAVSVQEIEKFSARSQLANLSVSGRTAALAGVTQSPNGFESTFTDQLLFYVPPAATADARVQFLGYSQTMTGARQLDASEVTFG